MARGAVVHHLDRRAAQLLIDAGFTVWAHILSGLIEARDEQGALTEQELLSLAFLTLFAGYDNAVHLIGNATLGLLLHPEQMKAARSGATPVRARESLDQGHPAATDAGSDD